MARRGLVTWGLVVVWVLALVAWPTATVADEPPAGPDATATAAPLTQIYTAQDSSFSFSFPSGWVYQYKPEKRSVALGTERSLLADTPGHFEPGQVAVFVLPTLDEVSQAIGKPLAGKGRADVLAALAGGAPPKPGEAEEIIIGGRAANRVVSAGDGDTDVLLLAMDTSPGVVSVLMTGVAPGEISAVEPTVRAIAASLKVRASPAAVETAVPPESSEATGSVLRQWATGAEATSQYGDSDWSAQQATGAPNVNECGDNKAAWASLGAEEKSTLTLHYDTPVSPVQINIYQSFSPGSITSVELALADGSGTLPLPNSADPNKTCPHVLRLKLGAGTPLVNGVIVHLDQSIGGNWNEIDAVELVGRQ